MIDSVDALCLKILTDSLLTPVVQRSVTEAAIHHVCTEIEEDLFTPPSGLPTVSPTPARWT